MRNKYQSFVDYLLGRWCCPVCGRWWYSPFAPSDCLLVTVEKGVVIERRVECPVCGFSEVVWSGKRKVVG